MELGYRDMREEPVGLQNTRARAALFVVQIVCDMFPKGYNEDADYYLDQVRGALPELWQKVRSHKVSRECLRRMENMSFVVMEYIPDEKTARELIRDGKMRDLWLGLIVCANLFITDIVCGSKIYGLMPGFNELSNLFTNIVEHIIVDAPECDQFGLLLYERLASAMDFEEFEPDERELVLNE